MHRKTVDRWHQSQKFPEAVLICARLLLDRDLGAICPLWEGWTLQDDALYSPENEAATWGQIRSIRLRLQLIETLQRSLEIAEDTEYELRLEIHDLNTQVTDPIQHRISQLRRELAALETLKPTPNPVPNKPVKAGKAAVGTPRKMNSVHVKAKS